MRSLWVLVPNPTSRSTKMVPMIVVVGLDRQNGPYNVRHETDLRDSSSERGGIFRKPSELIVSYIQCIGSLIGGGLGNPFLWGVKKIVTKLTSTNGISPLKSENRISDYRNTSHHVLRTLLGNCPCDKNSRRQACRLHTRMSGSP